MRKKVSPWLVSIMALFISYGASGVQTVHADEIAPDGEIVQCEEADETEETEEKPEAEAVNPAETFDDDEEETVDSVEEEIVESADTEAVEPAEAEAVEPAESNAEESVEETSEAEQVITENQTEAVEENTETDVEKIDMIEETADPSTVQSGTDAEKAEALKTVEVVKTNDEDLMGGPSISIGWNKEDNGKWRYYYGTGSDDYYKDTKAYIEGSGNYIFDDNGYPMSGWLNYEGKTYYADESNKIKTGWFFDEGSYYYADSEGALVQGWLEDKGVKFFLGWPYVDYKNDHLINGYAMLSGGVFDIWGTEYWFADNGVLRTGWFKQSMDDWFHADKITGALSQGWETIDNNTYHFGTTYLGGDNKFHVDGHMMQQNMWELYGNTYYFGTSGALKKGWINYYGDGSTYLYADQDGVLQQGWQNIGMEKYFLGRVYNGTDGDFVDGYDLRTDEYFYYEGKHYYVDKYGAMQSGFFEIKNFYDSNPCYAESDGNIVTGWKTIDGKKYYIKDLGYLATGIEDIDGTMYCFGERGNLKTGWVEAFANSWYYFDSNGVMVDGWKTISGKKYYLDNGCMASGLTRIGEKVYYFNKDGALVTNQQGWKKLDADSTSSPEENEFFLYNDGTVKTGFMTVGDVTYGFDDYGYLMKNETGYNPADSRYYLFDENGKMIKKKGWVSAKRLTYGDGSSDPYYRQEWFYLNPDYTIRLNGLWNINGTNYAFNLEGAMMSGQMVPYIYDYDKKAYREVLLGEDGKEITSNGWHKIKSEWYYYNAGKIFYDKIAVINGSKYAFDYDGKLKVNTTFKYDDLFYKADSDGRLQLAPKGWNKVETYGYTSNAYEWYYLSETGKVSNTNSWITSGKDKYYISNGRMATGVYFIDDDYDYYVFADDGRLVKGWTKSKKYGWLYGADDGKAYDGVLTLGGKSYYIQNGELMYSYVDGDGNIFMADSSGAFRTTMGFFNRKIERYNIFSDTVTTENQICYVNRNKQGLAAGWQTINGNTYYFRQGVALTGVQYINSDKFVFDSNGKLISKR